MVYLEAFILYWLFVVFGLVAVILIAFVMIEFYKLIRKLLHKSVPTFGLKGIIKVILPIYIIAFAVVYVDKGYDNLYKDRPYKEAKSYALAGEVIFIYKKVLLRFVYPDNILFKPLQFAHRIILSKINEYIPKEDGEREIWNYKFNSFDYARTMFAPISKVHTEINGGFTNPNISMDEGILPLITDIYTTMKDLDEKPIKDKKFDRFDRYLAIASMAPYYAMYYKYQASLYYDVNISREKWFYIYEMVWKNEKLKSELFHYINILNNTREQWDKDKMLAEAFEQRPNIKVAFYWGVLKGYQNMPAMEQELYKTYLCTSPLFLQEVAYYKEFVHWAYMTKGSSYNKLSKRERKTYDFLLERNSPLYYAAKYVCKIPFKYMTKRERGFDPKHRDRLMRGAEDNRYIAKIREIEKELKIKGENHVR